MKKLTKLSLAITTAIMMTSSLAIAAPGKAEYDKAVAAANAALDKAASVQGEWHDSRWKKSTFVKYKTKDGKTIKSSYMGAAAAAAADGDYASAMKFLETATFQGNMGYEQAMGQKNAGPRL